jgi:Sulfatase-modifying factor enzyme 1
MRHIGFLLLLLALFLNPLFSGSSLANEALNSCIEKSINSVDPNKWVDWVALAMAHHPEIAKMTNVSNENKQNIQESAGQLFQKTLSVDCKKEIDKLPKSEADTLLASSFASLFKQTLNIYNSKLNFRESLETKSLCKYCIEVVKIPNKNIMVGKYEVTQKEWESVMGYNPSTNKDCGELCPVESVNWEEVNTFISKINHLTGLNYRLPTIDEWAASLVATNMSWKSFFTETTHESYSWYKHNSGGVLHEVGKKRPNDFGLYDMIGNVWERTSTEYCTTLKKANGKPFCLNHLVVGGSFLDSIKYIEEHGSNHSEDKAKIEDYGFRLVLDVSETNF